MANPHWDFVLQLLSGTTAKAEDVNANFAGIDAGFVSVTADMDQALKVINGPGVVDINLNAAARANKIVSFDGAGGVLASIYIGNYQGNHAAAAGTVYNVRDTVKDSTGSLGQDNIYICNVSHTSTGTLSTDTANWDVLVDVAAVSASAAASAASASAALISENNAATSYDNFDDRELGAFTTANEPTLDNDGNALLDGAQYWDTTLKRKKIYDLANTVWLLTTANAVDMNVADAGGLFNAINSEVALQEVMAAASGVLSTGTTSALVLTYGLPVPVSNDIYTFTSVVNALAAATLNIDSGGAKPIVNEAGIAIILGDIIAGGTYRVRSNGISTFVLINPSRSKESLSVNTSVVVGNEIDIPLASLFSGSVPVRIGQSGLLVGTDASNTFNLNNNYYVDSGGSDVRINDGLVSGIIMTSSVDIIVAPSALAAVAPVFKTPLSIDIETGVITISEPAGFQALYQKPAVTGGGAGTYTAVLGISSYIVNTVYSLIINSNNLGASTLNIDGVGVQSIVLRSSGVNIPLVAKELMVNQKYDFLWDGANFVLQNPSEVIGSFITSITTGGGTVTLSGTGDTLTFRSYRSVCQISGALSVSAVSSPTGTAQINTFPYNIYATSTPSDAPAAPVPFSGLVTAPALGLFLTPTFTESNVMSLREQLSTGINSNTAPLIGVSTLLYINFEYRFR